MTDIKQEQIWQAEQDARTLMHSEEIRIDSGRMSRAQTELNKLADEKRKEIELINKLSTKKKKSARIISDKVTTTIIENRKTDTSPANSPQWQNR